MYLFFSQKEWHIIHSLKCAMSFSSILRLAFPRCHSSPFFVTCCHLLSFVVTRCTTLCHSFSLYVSLVCRFINDRLYDLITFSIFPTTETECFLFLSNSTILRSRVQYCIFLDQSDCRYFYVSVKRIRALTTTWWIKLNFLQEALNGGSF